MFTALVLVLLSQNPPDMLAMHCGPATDWVVTTAEGPVDPTYIKKSGDYFFGRINGTAGGTNTIILYPQGGTISTTAGFVMAPYPFSGAVSGMVFTGGNTVLYNGGNAVCTLGGSTATFIADVRANQFISDGQSGAAISINGTGFYQSAGDTAGNISGKSPGAGSGALIYDDTNQCWRSWQANAWHGCVQENNITDGGWGPTNNTVFRLASVTTAAGAVDSTMNTMLVGQKTAVTVTQLTGLVATPGTGAGTTIQFECTGIISGKRCLADIACANTIAGFDGGAAFTVNFFGYGGASNCSFNNDIVRCLGRNAPVDGGTDCTLDPVMTVNSLAIEGTYP